MHIGMNMMSTAAIGTLLEKRFGSLWYAFTVCWGIVLTSVIYIVAAWFGSFLRTDMSDGLMYGHSVGFSGVIFQLSVLESSLSPDRVRSVFGFVNVGAAMYPWALLVFMQFVMPQVSFWGHLSGILVGTLQSYNLLTGLLPSNAYLIQMEQDWPFLQRYIVGKPNFVPTPHTIDISDSRNPNRDLKSCGRTIVVGLQKLCLFVKHVCETFKVILFGNDNTRGSVGNNAVVSSSSGVGGNIDMRETLSMIEATDDDDDDDNTDWQNRHRRSPTRQVHSTMV